MDLKAKIQEDIKTAMKAQDSLKLGTLRMLHSEIKRKEIDKRIVLDESEIQKVIQSMLKQRADSIEAFVKGAREDLAEKERQEVEILKAYMPAQMPRAELEQIVMTVIQETGANTAADIGKVMKAVLAKVAGKADGKTVNEIAKAKLTGAG
jgi:uncharacterized protein YqeY